jgi:hypothetical protein
LDEPQDFGLGDRPAELARGRRAREVDEGTQRRGERQAVATSDVTRFKRRGAVNRDAGPRPWGTAIDEGEVDHKPRLAQQPPQGGGGPMAQDRVRPERQQGGGLGGERRRHRVTDEVDTSVDGMQPAVLDAVLDRPPAQSHRPELSPGHHTVLAAGDLTDPNVERVNNCDFVARRRSSAPRRAHGVANRDLVLTTQPSAHLFTLSSSLAAPIPPSAGRDRCLVAADRSAVGR